MTSKTHYLNSQGTQRITVSTIGTVIPFFVEWGGEARHEIQRKFLFWTYWSTEGTTPNFSVEFVDEFGQVYNQDQISASNEHRAGYRKRAIFAINAPLVRPITNVRVRYSVEGESRSMLHKPNYPFPSAVPP